MEQEITRNHLPILYTLFIVLSTIFILNIKKRRNNKKRRQLAEATAEKRRRAQESIANLAKMKSSIDYTLFGDFYLPRDIIYDILMRLPLASLLQMRCLNKSWNRFLRTPEFNHFHLYNRLDQQKSQHHFFKIWQTYEEGTRGSYLVSFTCEDLEEQSLVKVMPNGTYVSVGCCNGLICLESMDDIIDPNKEYVMFNPLTKEFRAIPCPSTPCSKIHFLANSGFGFIQETYDYKILRVERIVKREEKSYMQYMVYTLGIGSWKQSCVDMEYDIADGYSPQLHDHLHLWGIKRRPKDSQPYTIITFDLKNETLGILPFPEKVGRIYSRMCVWRDHLAVVSLDYSDRGGFSTIFNVWVMKQYGNGDSWTKFSVKPHLDFCSFGGMAKNGRLLLYCSLDHYLYDVDAETITRPAKIFGRFQDSQALCYEGSLVTFGGRFPEPKVPRMRKERQDTICFHVFYGSMFVFLCVLYFLLLVDGYFKKYILMFLPASTKT